MYVSAALAHLINKCCICRRTPGELVVGSRWDPSSSSPPHPVRWPGTSDFRLSVFSLQFPETSSDFVFDFSLRLRLRLRLRLVFDMSQTRLTTRLRHVSDSSYDSSSTCLRLVLQTRLRLVFDSSL